jgi:ABC-type bacteriocin/lantibiotic exporter with double-glycine peptidase domain
LYVSLKALDFPVASYEALEQRLGPPSEAGYSMGQLAEAAQGLGASTLGVATTVENLRRRPGRFACIALLKDTHFVNIADISDQGVSVVDPPRSSTVPVDTFLTQWDGSALLIAPSPLVAEEDLGRAVPGWLGPVLAGAIVVVMVIVFYRSRALKKPA